MLKHLLTFFLMLATAQAQSQESLDEVQAISRRIIPEGFSDWPEARREGWLVQQLENTTDPSAIYVLKRTLFDEKFVRDELKEAVRICMDMDHVPDDFSLRLRCIDAAEGIIPHEEARQSLVELYQEARRMNRNSDAVDILNILAWMQSQDGDIAESLASYTEALELVPKKDERTRFNILFNLATIYTIHGNDAYVRKGIEHLNEIKAIAAERSKNKGTPEAALYLADFQLAAFNIGIAYTLHLYDYEKAIPEFEHVMVKGHSNRAEALTFAALAAAGIQRLDLAKKFLSEINGEESPSEIEESYLKCYRALTIRHWDRGNSLQSCFTLHPDTTLEVVSDINWRLTQLKGHPEEIEGLRAHVRMYEERIKPEYKNRATKAASNAELKRLESEGRLKDEKIALGEKIKILLYVVLVISVLLLAFVLLVLRSRLIIKTQAHAIHLQKQNLQHVLDNIDEGIIAINRKGRISRVHSRYAAHILKQNPDQLSLAELLTELGLKGDALVSAREVFEAVLGEEPLTWELNEGLLPPSGIIHGTPFQYYWAPIVRAGRITEVILSMRDASATLALQKEASTRNRILSVVNAGSIGHNFVWDLDTRLGTLRQGLNKDNVAQTLRLAHTIKGEARSLRFTDLQDNLHLLEQSLLQDDFVQALHIMDDIDNAAQALHEAFDLIKHGDRSALGHPIMGILQTVMTDAHRRLHEEGFELISDIQISWVELSDDEISALRDILIHGVGNSIDHGYLLPRKKNIHCDQLAHISIQLHVKAGDVHCSISDQGVGIDWKALEEIARQRNWTPPKDSDLTDIVFVDKVSTVAGVQVSKTSGRGIGMAAVAEAVKSLQGVVKFGPGFNNCGARLDIRWKHRATHDKPDQAAS
jgi:HPt (histidine-containing phosphotransfer) domain-containing protein/PAS domain-containing protein